jgi:hypothetical protein
MNFFRIWAKIETMQKLLAECEKASKIPDRALMTTALTSVIKEAEELRPYARPKEWLTLEERAEQHRQETGRDERQDKAG